jgi:phage-related protein
MERKLINACKEAFRKTCSKTAAIHALEAEIQKINLNIKLKADQYKLNTKQKLTYVEHATLEVWNDKEIEPMVNIDEVGKRTKRND